MSHDFVFGLNSLIFARLNFYDDLMLWCLEVVDCVDLEGCRILMTLHSI